MKYYFYILRCKDNSLYCGQTNDLERRVREHNFDKKRSAKYLRGKTPARLVYFEEFPTKSEALKREAEIKKWAKNKKEALVGNNLNLLKKIKDKRAIIWDFDGVIMCANWSHGEDFDKWWDKLWSLLEKYEPNIKQVFKKGLKYNHEHTDYIIKKYGEKAFKEINNFYLKKELYILPFSYANKNLIEIIRKIDPKVEQYIWSNNQGPFIKKFLKKESLLNEFKSIVSRDMFKLAKPNLDGLKSIQTLTSIPMRDFILVGDSEKTDHAVAKKIGMKFFLYDKVWYTGQSSKK